MLDCTPTHTVAVAVDIPILVHGAAGAVYMRDVALNNGGTVSKGIDEHGPSGGTASVPLRLINVTLDNLAGVGLNLEYVTDCQMIGGWINAAAGTGNGAVRFLGGGLHTIMGVEQLNGGGGSACSFDFAGGAPVGITLIGNYPSTGPIYRISGTPPTDLLIHDRITTAAAIANVTNDPEALRAAMSPLWTPPRRMQREFVRVSGTNPPAGYATLPGGSPNSVTVAHTAITAFSRVTVWRESYSGTPGHIACPIAYNVVGTSFTIFSNEPTDVGGVYWEIYDPV